MTSKPNFGIEAEHYGETRKALVVDPVVKSMAADVFAHHGDLEAARAAIAHPDGVTPRSEFMNMANAGYRSLGGELEDRHLGAVAEAIILILTPGAVEALLA